MSAFETGEYEIISRVLIRRQPRILPGNAVGILELGTKRRVHSIVTDDKNQTWGRISESDAAGVSQWICLQSINRTYGKPIQSAPQIPDFDFMERLARLEAWAKTQGYRI